MPEMELKSTDEFSFCPAAGEMAQRLRAFDWQSTTLGAPSGWREVLGGQIAWQTLALTAGLLTAGFLSDFHAH
ncbi:MAG: hypothetical protein JWP93_2425 [Polaromonas sp.]|nr:hypothetical protein [Polaromonas sp.]